MCFWQHIVSTEVVIQTQAGLTPKKQISPLCPADSQEASGEARLLKGNYDPPDSLKLDFTVTKPEESLGEFFTVTSYTEYIPPRDSFVKRGQHCVTCSFEFSEEDLPNFPQWCSFPLLQSVSSLEEVVIFVLLTVVIVVSNRHMGRVWWCPSVIPTRKRWRQEDREFKVIKARLKT